MSDTVTNPNQPPVNPLTLNQNLPKNLFPFSAFQFDDPNLTSPPVLRLKEPWQFSAGGPVKPLTAVVNADTAFNLPAIYPAQYTIYIPAAYLKVSGATGKNLTIQTPAGGTTVIVPLSPTGDTISSGALLFDVYVDSSGHVAS